MIGWRSPRTGATLRAVTPNVLADGAERWPVIDGIPFLRLGREALRDAALARIDAGDVPGATALLLADQDEWWTGPAAAPSDLAVLARAADAITLREAMRLLAWGRVADYFAHRWSDPTFVGGLALTEAHWNAPADAFELACGIGHHLRALARMGVAVTGGDVVFAKLWLARRFVVPQARLACFDAARPWPVKGAFDLVACHDAFYFLEPKRLVLDRLRGLLSGSGVLAISHVHNRDWPNLSGGSAMTLDEVRALTPDATIYDDSELTLAAAEARKPVPGADGGAEAFSFVTGPGVGSPRAVVAGIALPPPGAALRRNPLYGDDLTLVFPSERYATEYGPRATYPRRATAPPRAVHDAATRAWARSREMVDLPERW